MSTTIVMTNCFPMFNHACILVPSNSSLSLPHHRLGFLPYWEQGPSHSTWKPREQASRVRWKYGRATLGDSHQHHESHHTVSRVIQVAGQSHGKQFRSMLPRDMGVWVDSLIPTAGMPLDAKEGNKEN